MGGLFEGGGGLEDAELIEAGVGDLQAGGQAVLGEAAERAGGGESGEDAIRVHAAGEGVEAGLDERISESQRSTMQTSRRGYRGVAAGRRMSIRRRRGGMTMRDIMR
jgi:hypothetical protein